MISCHPDAGYSQPKFHWWVAKYMLANPYEDKLIKKCSSREDAEAKANELNSKIKKCAMSFY